MGASIASIVSYYELGQRPLAVQYWSPSTFIGSRDSSEPLDLVLDSTGLKIFGQGEWCRTKHGMKRRGWKKLHVGLDVKSGMIVSDLLTNKDADGPDQIDGPMARFMADGDPVYEVVRHALSSVHLGWLGGGAGWCCVKLTWKYCSEQE